MITWLYQVQSYQHRMITQHICYLRKVKSWIIKKFKEMPYSFCWNLEPLIWRKYRYIYQKVFFFKFIFIYLWLCWVFVSAQGLSLVAASGGHSSSRCAGLSLSRPLVLRSTGSRRAGSVIAAHGPSFSAACGILPDQGSNPCPLHWQADSQPLRHQGSPGGLFKIELYWVFKIIKITT